MAMVRDTVAIELADKLVTAATGIMNSIVDIEQVKEQADTVGINFATFDALFETLTSLRHVNGATLNRIIDDVGPQLRTLIEAPNTSASQTLKKRLYDAHRGTD